MDMVNYLIKNVKVIYADRVNEDLSDIRIRDGRIVRIGK